MTHYEVLGVPSTAPPGEVRRAYLELARRHHPDAGGDAAVMRSVNAAWAVLGDPQRRAAYDRELGGAGAPHAHAAAGGTDPHRPAEPFGPPDTADLGTPAAPSWLAVLPVGAFVASLLSGGSGLLLGYPGLLGFGVALFLLSCVLFFVAPFLALALAGSRRTGRPQ